MTTLVVRPLAEGEEDLFDSMPDPIPSLKQPSYAEGLAGGGFRPANTTTSTTTATTTATTRSTTGAPRSGTGFSLRTAESAAEIEEVVGRVATPAILTGSETAQLIRGVDLAREPLRWLTGPPGDWRVALQAGQPIGIMAATGDACYPMIAYLGLLDESALGELLADAAVRLSAEGALEIVADVAAERHYVIAELECHGFTAVRSRIHFSPPDTAQ